MLISSHPELTQTEFAAQLLEGHFTPIQAEILWALLDLHLIKKQPLYEHISVNVFWWVKGGVMLAKKVCDSLGNVSWKTHRQRVNAEVRVYFPIHPYIHLLKLVGFYPRIRAVLLCPAAVSFSPPIVK